MPEPLGGVPDPLAGGVGVPETEVPAGGVVAPEPCEEAPEFPVESAPLNEPLGRGVVLLVW